MNKKAMSIVLAAGILSAAAPTAVFADGATAGVCWYNAADTFIANATSTLNSIASADGTISVSMAARTGSANASYAEGYEMDTIASCIIGGAYTDLDGPFMSDCDRCFYCGQREYDQNRVFCHEDFRDSSA